MTETKKQLIESYRRKLVKAIGHLEYSYQKTLKLSAHPGQMDDEVLETWESFTSRFARVVDLYLTKYLRAKVLSDDPGFDGSLRDFLNYAEKINLISSADHWMELRGFRNLIAHEYEEAELGKNFESLRHFAPEVIAIKSRL